MEAKDIIFGEDLDLYTHSNELNSTIRVVLSDDLEASEEELTEEYKNKIASFINNLPDWYETALTAVKNYSNETYGILPNTDTIRLMNIFVLFEQDEEELFGLEFRLEFDVEHGCGLKMDNQYTITEVGTGDVAFC